MIEKTAALRVGDPTDPSTQIGPLAQPRSSLEALRAQVEESVAAGARQHTAAVRRRGLLGRPDRPRPAWTLDARVPRGDVRAGRGDRRVPDEEAAVELANDTDYGLGASVWTADHDRGRAVAARIDAGWSS